MAKDVYTVGIRRKFLPFYKKYKVVHHEQNSFVLRKELNNALNIQPRLFLSLIDGSEVCISRIELRDWKLYPDYRQKVNAEEQKRLKQEAKKKAKVVAAPAPVPQEVRQLMQTIEAEQEVE